ncbi:hypothetical protein C9374_001293 [Naegleria lovaniensis]|uniref:Glycylpeptide N-tetradecanoyltransferase n=1 Tax=Naegleria lovaniensis TaxID=51637 RepID=A0AA88KN70_NAELO|nr:uncharacterized protein C9374_001293 [Naegleria lovaniensis]KAG2387699.1 hypothetical protein C9374_001293 [Naegleria lovaniensis]
MQPSSSDQQPSNNNNSNSNSNTNSSTPATTKSTLNSITQEAIQNVAKYLPGGDTKRAEQEIVKDRKFWNNQPVPKIYEKVEQLGEIETKTVDQVQATPYTLPKGYEWYDLDVNSEEDISKLYSLLEGNYVEDDDAMFRFAYTKEFLRWALAPPGYRKDWHCVVRVESSKTFVGFIAAIPMLIGLRHEFKNESSNSTSLETTSVSMETTTNSDAEKFEKSVKMVEINFLCVHKKLREKRLAPLLIGEITRRVNLTNVWQAIYTAGVIIPRPISKARYYHRSLNPEKLIDIKFSSIPPFAKSFQNPLEVTKKYYKMNVKERLPTMRPLRKKDCTQVTKLLNDYLSHFKVAPFFTKEEVTHWFVGRENVIYSFVITAPDNDDKILDFISFYSLPSTIIGNPKHQVLKAAYLFFYTCLNTNVESLMKSALIEAQNRDFDVFNCVNIMDNQQFLDKLKFGTGDGYLYYYLFNYKFPDLQPEQVGLTML